MSPQGEKLFWARQNGASDPEAALAAHFAINDPPADTALFSYRHKNGHRVLTKPVFLQRLKSLVAKAGLDTLHGHSIRIGGTLEYLLRGIPFEVVKQKGRWAGESFKRYLRDHAQVMAPYMQAVPILHASILRYSMPSVR